MVCTDIEISIINGSKLHDEAMGKSALNLLVNTVPQPFSRERTCAPSGLLSLPPEADTMYGLLVWG
jgi:hypothetical protein